MLGAVSLSPSEFTATTASPAYALEVSPTGTTACHRSTAETLHTIAMAQAHNGSAITPTTMTGRHHTGAAILPILVTAPGAIESAIKWIATKQVDHPRGPKPSLFRAANLHRPPSCEQPTIASSTRLRGKRACGRFNEVRPTQKESLGPKRGTRRRSRGSCSQGHISWRVPTPNPQPKSSTPKWAGACRRRSPAFRRRE